MKSYRGLPLWSIIFLCITFLIYLIAYFCFRGNGIISSGIGLTKADWLGFFGAYLGTAATVLLSIVAIKQNKSLNLLNKKLMQKELLQKVPFVNISAKEICKPFSSLSADIQEILQSKQPCDDLAPVMQIENQRQQYFIIKKTLSELRIGLPYMDPEVQAIIRSQDCCDLLRKIELRNLSDVPALNIKLRLDQEYNMQIHLGPKEAINYLFVLSEKIDFSITISYNTIDDSKGYQQTCTYNVLKNHGIWHGSSASMPQPIEYPQQKPS